MAAIHGMFTVNVQHYVKNKAVRVSTVFIIVAALALTYNAIQNNKPFDYYILALSWSPSFCLNNPEHKKSAQCTETDRDTFIVHGLWPQYINGWPSWCDTGQHNIAPSVMKSMQDIMPGERLIQHQWRKHGSCTGLSSHEYFEKTLKAYKSIVLDFKDISGSEQSTASIIENILAQNTKLRKENFILTCRNRRLHELRVCLSKSLKFIPCQNLETSMCEREIIYLPE
jgi:ribonuclease T2